MNKNILIKVLVLVTYIEMVVVNFLANILPINGVNTGQISDSFPNLFAPAGLTFSIWGLIYTLLALYTLFQFNFLKKEKTYEENELLKKIGIYFSTTSIINVLWIFAWHYGFVSLSVLLMLVLLFLLIKISLILDKKNLSLQEKLFVKLPFNVYFGWITVATIANISVLLVSLGWDGFGIADHVWTIIILSVGAFIGLTRIIKGRDYAYGLVFIWAYFGIYVKHTSIDGFNGEYPSIITTVIVCIVLFVLSEIFILLRGNKLKENL